MRWHWLYAEPRLLLSQYDLISCPQQFSEAGIIIFTFQNILSSTTHQVSNCRSLQVWDKITCSVLLVIHRYIPNYYKCKRVKQHTFTGIWDQLSWAPPGWLTGTWGQSAQGCGHLRAQLGVDWLSGFQRAIRLRASLGPGCMSLSTRWLVSQSAEPRGQGRVPVRGRHAVFSPHF